MSSGSSIENSYINSIIGEGTTFKGDISIKGLLRIDGDYKGSIDSLGKILIGKNGRAECNIKADTVVIGGAIKGNIIATNRIAILSSGLVIGNIKTPRLDIEDKVIFHGKCIVTKNESNDFNNNMIISNKDKSDLNKNDLSKYNPANK